MYPNYCMPGTHTPEEIEIIDKNAFEERQKIKKFFSLSNKSEIFKNAKFRFGLFIILSTGFNIGLINEQGKSGNISLIARGVNTTESTNLASDEENGSSRSTQRQPPVQRQSPTQRRTYLDNNNERQPLNSASLCRLYGQEAIRPTPNMPSRGRSLNPNLVMPLPEHGTNRKWFNFLSQVHLEDCHRQARLEQEAAINPLPGVQNVEEPEINAPFWGSVGVALVNAIPNPGESTLMRFGRVSMGITLILTAYGVVLGFDYLEAWCNKN